MSRLSFSSAKPDLALAGLGFFITTAFVSTDGNGQNPIPVAIIMLMVATITCLVSFLLASVVRTLALAIIATIVVTDLLFVTYFMYRVTLREHVDRHVAEEAFLVPIVFAIVTAPLVVLCSIGFGRIANRFFQTPQEPAGSQLDSAEKQETKN